MLVFHQDPIIKSKCKHEDFYFYSICGVVKAKVRIIETMAFKIQRASTSVSDPRRHETNHETPQLPILLPIDYLQTTIQRQ